MKFNLIPQEEKKKGIQSPVAKAAVISIVTVALLFLILGIRYFIAKSKMDSLLNEDSFAATQEESLKDFKEGYEKYKSHPAIAVLKNHTYFSKLFKKIEEATPQNFRLTSFSVDENLQGRLDAEVSGGYAEISRFSKGLKKAGFLDSTIKSVSSSGGIVRFSMEFKCPKEMILE